MSGLTFTKATKRQAYLRLALEGPAGFGKTYTALEVATHLVSFDGRRFAALDTEFGSMSKYAHLFDYDSVDVGPPFHPHRAVEAITAAVDAGYGAIVLDSLSHFWNGEGGLLEMVDEIAKTKYRGDSHRAWKDAGLIQQELTDAILRSPIHVIACMRTKKEYVRDTVEKDGRETTRIRAAGTKTVQREEFDFEFDLIGRFDTPTNLALVKSRCDTLPPETIIPTPGLGFARDLHDWLSAGEMIATATDAQHEQLAQLCVSLTGLDDTRNWRKVAEQWVQREVGPTRNVAGLTDVEIVGLIAAFDAHLDTLTNPPAPEPGNGAVDEQTARQALEGASV